MKHSYKQTFLLSIIVLMTLLLTACSSPEATYKSAQDLLAKGKYAEAANRFESLGSYEEAATLTIYCKACALCEEGNFQIGIAALENLGNYKDSKMRITYYTARSWDDSSVGTTEFEQMQRAKNIYQGNPLYLDSAERMAALDKRIEIAKSTLYNDAVAAGNSGNYTAACYTFNRLGNYKDSTKRYTYYGIREDEGKLADSTNQDAVLAVAARYTDMNTFLDCAARAAAMKAKADAIVTNKYAAIAALIDEGKYAAGEALLASFGKYGNEQVAAYYYAIGEKYLEQHQWEESSSAFKKAGSYSDAKARSSEPFYREGEALLAENKWEDAAAAFKKAGFYSDANVRINETYYMQGLDFMANANWSAAIEAFQKVSFYKDSADQIKICEYNVAVALKNTGKYKEAYDAFIALNGHADSKAQADSILNEHRLEIYQSTKVGDIFTFGSYEQDANTVNVKEYIEWLVLAKENNRLLLLSLYALDSQPYNEKDTWVTWETCTLRKWLNNDFLNEAFSNTEKAIIPTVTVSAEKNPDYNTHPGNATQDKVFLLSLSEVNKYFVSNSTRVCNPTVYARIQGAHTNDGGSCWWWMRSPGDDRKSAASVNLVGAVVTSGTLVSIDIIAVRPAMWIELN